MKEKSKKLSLNPPPSGHFLDTQYPSGLDFIVLYKKICILKKWVENFQTRIQFLNGQIFKPNTLKTDFFPKLNQRVYNVHIYNWFSIGFDRG